MVTTAAVALLCDMLAGLSDENSDAESGTDDDDDDGEEPARGLMEWAVPHLPYLGESRCIGVSGQLF